MLQLVKISSLLFNAREINFSQCWGSLESTAKHCRVGARGSPYMPALERLGVRGTLCRRNVAYRPNGWQWRVLPKNDLVEIRARRDAELSAGR
jgi:hypothetical protein